MLESNKLIVYYSCILEFKKTFSIFDKDGNGKISLDELSAVMETMGFIPTEAEVEEMMKAIDTDGKLELFYKFEHHHYIKKTYQFHFKNSYEYWKFSGLNFG